MTFLEALWGIVAFPLGLVSGQLIRRFVTGR